MIKRIADMEPGVDVIEDLGFKVVLTGKKLYSRYQGKSFPFLKGVGCWYFEGDKECEIIGRVGPDGKFEEIKS